jgi:pyruvate kinase
MKPVELICTVKTADCTPAMLSVFAKNGMTILRLNTSHISVHELPEILREVRSAQQQSMDKFKVMLDLPGPEIRITLPAVEIELSTGMQIQLCTSDYCDPDLENVLFTDCQDFDHLQHNNSIIQFMNGEITGKPILFTSHRVCVLITRGGVLRPNSHVNFVTADQYVNFLSDRDLALAEIGLKYQVDYLALSMVRHPEEIHQFRNWLQQRLQRNQPLIVVKFETNSSIARISSILAASDACFVARGDLGTQINPYAIPLLQRRIIAEGISAQKPVFIATGMLSSMVEREFPTRAEINDIATAIMDGATGITLSEETAIGSHPLQAISTVKGIIDYVTDPDKDQKQELYSDFQLAVDLWQNLSLDAAHAEQISELKTVGRLIWERGWAEANAGNVSYRICASSSYQTMLSLSRIGKLLLGKTDLEVEAYDWFLVSATGSRYREIADKQFGNFVLIMQPHLEQGSTNRNRGGAPSSSCLPDSVSPSPLTVQSGSPLPLNAPPAFFTFPSKRKPTSEWVTHQAVHAWLQENRKAHLVILHAHPTDWITLSSLPEYRDDKAGLAARLCEVLPELKIYFPQGFALTPYQFPGSDALAQVTLNALSDYNVIIWEGHGVFVTAESVNQAFDFLEIIAKAASVYLQQKCLPAN